MDIQTGLWGVGGLSSDGPARLVHRIQNAQHPRRPHPCRERVEDLSGRWCHADDQQGSTEHCVRMLSLELPCWIVKPSSLDTPADRLPMMGSWSTLTRRMWRSWSSLHRLWVQSCCFAAFACLLPVDVACAMLSGACHALPARSKGPPRCCRYCTESLQATESPPDLGALTCCGAQGKKEKDVSEGRLALGLEMPPTSSGSQRPLGMSSDAVITPQHFARKPCSSGRAGPRGRKSGSKKASGLEALAED